MSFSGFSIMRYNRDDSSGLLDGVMRLRSCLYLVLWAFLGFLFYMSIVFFYGEATLG